MTTSSQALSHGETIHPIALGLLTGQSGEKVRDNVLMC